jgi:hypothetical protein
MKPALIHRIFLISVGLWLGAILSVGYLAAPVIFTKLPDRQLAGLIAGELFSMTTTITIVLGLILLGLSNWQVSRGFQQYRQIRWLVLLILLLAIGGSLMQLWMMDLKRLASVEGASVMQSTYATPFARLHGISSILFLLESVVGLFAFWKLTKTD